MRPNLTWISAMFLVGFAIPSLLRAGGGNPPPPQPPPGQEEKADCTMVGGMCTNPNGRCIALGGSCAVPPYQGSHNDYNRDGCGCQW